MTAPMCLQFLSHDLCSLEASFLASLPQVSSWRGDLLWVTSGTLLHHAELHLWQHFSEPVSQWVMESYSEQ